MHWEIVQAIVNECDAYDNGDSYTIPSREILVLTIVELAAQLRRLNAALMDETKRIALTGRTVRTAVPTTAEGSGE